MNIYLVGYQKKYFFKSKHTNWWPWNYLKDTFNELGYKTYHLNPEKIDQSKPGIFICWNEPDSITFIDKYQPHPDSIIIQKLTGFDSAQVSEEELSKDPLVFFNEWNWPQYQKLYALEKKWPNFYAFGALIDTDRFPLKRDIIRHFNEKIFWIPWGSMTVSYDRIMKAKPVLSNFAYDVGFVGSKWGTKIRGNVTEWEEYLQPIIDAASKTYIAGKGTPKGPVSVEEHERALIGSKICPIIHATSWKMERGIMDRFWTVFSLGRFGVVDNDGILYFYNEDEVVLETDPEGYIEKSIYYMKNPDKQLPYIEKAMKRIKEEYNQHMVWGNILKKIFMDNKLS